LNLLKKGLESPGKVLEFHLHLRMGTLLIEYYCRSESENLHCLIESKCKLCSHATEEKLISDNCILQESNFGRIALTPSHRYSWPSYSKSTKIVYIYCISISGALIICKKGTYVNGKHKDIDRDFVLLFTVMDETRSWLLNKNIKEYCSPNFTMPRDEAGFKAFRDSNNIHMINGYIFGNVPGLEMCVGDRVDWHLFGMGSETDLHSSMFFVYLTVKLV
jgi:hypothetical protein